MVSSAKRIENAMRRVEEASAELLAAANNYGGAMRGTWNDQQQMQAVHLMARRYAAAMRNLQRVSRP
jgi:hypothetical protein